MEAMYALVKTGGKQYRVAKDDKILVERIAADEGAEIILDDIIMLGDGDKVTVGTPRVEGAAVSAKVVSQTRGPKIIIFRRKRRKNHRRTQGHRQDLTLLQITAIAEDGKALKPKSAPAKKAAPKAEAAKAAPKQAAKKAAPKAEAKAAMEVMSSGRSTDQQRQSCAPSVRTRYRYHLPAPTFRACVWKPVRSALTLNRPSSRGRSSS